MGADTILSIFGKGTRWTAIEKALRQHHRCHVRGTVGSAVSILVTLLQKQQPILLILEDKQTAAYAYNDLQQLLGESTILFYPTAYKKPYQTENIDNANILLRSEVVNRIKQDTCQVVVSYPEALFEKVVSQQTIDTNILRLCVGDTISLELLNEMLFEYHFQRVDFVSDPGQFSVRGGIVDIYSYSEEQPYRVEFFGDDIESIRSFDIITQLSEKQLDTVNIMPNFENSEVYKNRHSFLEYLPSKTLLCFKDLSAFIDKTQQLFAYAQDKFENLDTQTRHSPPETLFCDANSQLLTIKKAPLIELSNTPYYTDSPSVMFSQQAQPSFNKKFDLLISSLEQYHQQGYTNYIACDTKQQAQRFEDIFRDIGKPVHYQKLHLSLSEGFIDPDQKVCCLTDHQIFERYHKYKLHNINAKKQALTLSDYNQLSIGDFVTHIDHGIGRFAGLEKIDAGDKKQEAIKLIYGDRDILYVSIHSLYKISKYNSKDGTPPKIYKLGSKAWANLKEKTKHRVKEVAYNLIDLYAKRSLKKGFACAPDSYLQHELEASFIYEDTPDQSTATAAVKADMERDTPMDRLICGDVGFGKTEVAIRAAFKAVDNGKQVAVLVPTTILAFQHHNTFVKRLEELPITVDYINRFRTTKERNETLERLKNGQVDIIIGTHQLINKNIAFKDLGLLIVDEEQKFGVGVKDKIKTIKTQVDVLTLTATPIPRTLQFSLMAARDLSIINTPPPNRHPIESKVVRWNETLIRDAILHEIQRGGQVFFVHNRIENLKEISGMLQRLLPDARIATGHGQMDGKTMEQLMLDFMEGNYDILVSTTIIESGLDIPNANTIFINNAHQFGLSDLHQMRGRVGRSNKYAFCYFISISKTDMTENARKRMTTLEQFTALGSGFSIAMKDLEIRGAGDLLGGEQSGFITDMGFETYQKILQEAVNELKERNFNHLYQNDVPIYVNEVQIDTDFEILLPDDYVNNVKERLNLYNQLTEVKDEKDLALFEVNLKDRFGDLPDPVIQLLNSVRLKWYAAKMGLERLILKQNKMTAYFISNQQSKFYNSNDFKQLLNNVNAASDRCHLKEKNTRSGLRLTLSFEQIDSISTALSTLQLLLSKG